MLQRQLTWKRQIGFVIALTVLLTSVLSLPVSAAFPGINGRIAFDSKLQGTPQQVYSILPDGTDPLKITSSGVAEYNPSYSADGTKIAFVRGSSAIWTMNADGSNQTMISNQNDFAPSWSPDGTKIVFSSARGGQPRLWTMNADGTNPVQLTSNAAGGPDVNPDWSPDGTKIVFHSIGGVGGIYTISSTGTGLTRVSGTVNTDNNASWSPDGTKIVFDAIPSGIRQIFIMNANGSNRVNISNNAWADTRPDYSPDGTKIVFNSDRDATGNRELYTMNINGSDPFHVSSSSDTSVNEAPPSWQPLTLSPHTITPDPTFAYSGSPLVYDVVTSTTDAYGEVNPATIVITSAPTKGTATVDATAGTISYTPTPTTAVAPGVLHHTLRGLSNFFMPKASAQSTTSDAYTYQVCSGASSLLCTSNTVTITGLPVAGAAGLAPTGQNAVLLQIAGISLLLIGTILLVRRKLLSKQG